MNGDLAYRLQITLLVCNFSLCDVVEHYEELLQQLWYEFGFNGAIADGF